MKKEILKRLTDAKEFQEKAMNSSELGYKDTLYEKSIRQGHIKQLENIINFLNSLPEPEPLDPYTCELMVGDVVEYKGSICVLYDTKNYFYLVHQLTGVLTGTKQRNQLKLTQRNGATIKEVGNG